MVSGVSRWCVINCIEIVTLWLMFWHDRAKRSWFANFRSERDKEEVVVVFRDKGFSDLKMALMQAFKVSGFLPVFCLFL